MNISVPEISIHSIAQFLLSDLLPADISTIRELKDPEDMIKFHHGAGTWIRNEFNFWTPECPLTKEWHEDSKNNTNKYIDEHGTDNHPKHPDAVSHEVLKELWRIIHGSQLHLNFDIHVIVFGLFKLNGGEYFTTWGDVGLIIEYLEETIQMVNRY